MKTTREVFIIMRAGKIDKRDHEIVKKTQFCQFVNNTIGSPKIGLESFILMIEHTLVSILFDLTRATLLSLRKH